jgi:ribosome-binding protein aMBF1 (putative translation factor)
VPQCKSCGEEVEELLPVKVNGKTKRLCESCADQENESEAIKQDSEAVVQNMMGFKGRR